MKFNVYRAIHLQANRRQWQLISVIEAENIDIANARAKFIPSFHTWDMNPGLVIALDDTQPKLVTTSENLNTIQATPSGNQALHAMKTAIDNEYVRHNTSLSELRNRYCAALITM